MKKVWKKITSLKNWLLIGAIIGVLFIFLFNLIFLTVNFKNIYFISEALSFVIVLITSLASSFSLSLLLRYALLGALTTGILKLIKNKTTGKIKLIVILSVFILVGFLIFLDLKPLGIYSCSSKDLFLVNDCLHKLAITKKDSEICYYIFDEYEKRDCIIETITSKAIARKNDKICYKLEIPGENSDYYDIADCITQVAKNEEDESRCEQLGEGFGKVREECYKEVAIIKMNLNLCPDYKQEECYREILSKSDDPIRMCENLKTRGSLWKCYKNIDCSKSINIIECNLKVKEALVDIDFCKIETSEYDKNQCYKDFAIRLNNPELCMKIEGIGAPEPCLKELAIINNNLDFCFIWGYSIQGCIFDFIDKNNDVNLCYKLTTGEIEIGNCINRYASNNNNLTVCNLSPSITRESCISNILNARRDGKLPEN